MLTRILTSIVSLFVLLPILYFSNTYVFPIAVAIMTVIALYEMFSCVGCKSKYALTIPTYLTGAAIPIVGKIANSFEAMLPLVCAIIIIYAIYLFLIAIVFNKDFTIGEIALCYMTSIYIIFGFSSILFLRLISNYTYLLIFIGAWVTDIFAYFTGKFFGKRKLCVEISPQKTIAGSIGGTFFCIIAFVTFGFIALNKEASIWQYAALAVLGLIIAIVSQIGDLSMSLIKRHYGIKDFGKVFPGHGGVLDRFDSIIAVSSILFIMLTFMKTLGINILI